MSGEAGVFARRNSDDKRMTARKKKEGRWPPIRPAPSGLSDRLPPTGYYQGHRLRRGCLRSTGDRLGLTVLKSVTHPTPLQPVKSVST